MVGAGEMKIVKRAILAIFCKYCQKSIFAKRAKVEYACVISPKMRAVSQRLIDAFVGMDHCITETPRNLIVEVPKSMCEAVRAELKQSFDDVALIRNAYPMMEDLHDFILVKPLISEAPIYEQEGVTVPELEKMLVDHDADKEYAVLSDSDIQKEFQRAFEVYPVNTSRLLRYAGRKGKKEEIQNRILRIDLNRVDIVRSIQDYLRQEPVEKAWLSAPSPGWKNVPTVTSTFSWTWIDLFPSAFSTMPAWLMRWNPAWAAKWTSSPPVPSNHSPSPPSTATKS